MESILPGYARITEILGMYQAYAFVDRGRLKKATDIGTDIHAAIEAYLNEEFYPLHGSLEGYFSSFLFWLTNNEVKPIIQEKRYYDADLKITGKLDLLASVNGKTVLVDFKTGSWSHPEIWRLQGTFYRHLLALEGKDPIPDQFVFLQLQRTGDHPIMFNFDYNPKDWEICKKSVEIFRWFRKTC